MQALRRFLKIALRDVGDRNEEPQGQELRTPAQQEETAGKNVVIVPKGFLAKEARTLQLRLIPNGAGRCVSCANRF